MTWAKAQTPDPQGGMEPSWGAAGGRSPASPLSGVPQERSRLDLARYSPQSPARTEMGWRAI